MIGRRPAQLSRDVGLLGVVMLGAGTAIGVSIFSVLQPAAQIAGAGLLLAIAMSTVPMAIFGTVYAWLASIAPTSGASYEWPRLYLGRYVGFAIAWLRILGSVGILVLLARVLASYVTMIAPVPPIGVMVAAISGIFLLNLFGVGIAARAQVGAMLLLLGVLAAFVALGLPQASVARAMLPAGADPRQALAALPLMISLFFGIEAAVEIGDEVRDPKRTIARGILLSILLTAFVYGIVAAVALGLVGPRRLAASATPLLDAARVPFGRMATPLVVAAAIAAILKTMNATALIFSRSIFAMARSGALPSWLATIHRRYSTPWVALIGCYVLAMAGLTLPSSLVFLLLAINIPTLLKYLACSLCAIRVARSRSGRPGMVANGVMGVMGVMGVISAAAIIALGVQSDPRPYEMTVVWLLAGSIFYFAYAHRRVVGHEPEPLNGIA